MGIEGETAIVVAFGDWGKYAGIINIFKHSDFVASKMDVMLLEKKEDTLSILHAVNIFTVETRYLFFSSTTYFGLSQWGLIWRDVPSQARKEHSKVSECWSLSPPPLPPSPLPPSSSSSLPPPHHYKIVDLHDPLSHCLWMRSLLKFRVSWTIIYNQD